MTNTWGPSVPPERSGRPEPHYMPPSTVHPPTAGQVTGAHPPMQPPGQFPPAQQWPPPLPPTGQPAPTAPAQAERGVGPVSTEPFLIPRHPVPTRGWQQTVYRLTGGRWNPGLSAAEQEDLQLRASVTRPLRGTRRIAVLSRKGGVGKTTTTVGLGSTLAVHRGDRVIGLDGNPDAGNLAERIHGENEATVRDLINGADKIASYTDIRGYTSQAGSRLEVVAADQDPEISEAFNEQDYLRVQQILGSYYNILLTDCGTGVLHSAMRGILATADDLVIVVGIALDGVRKAGQTLDWLDAHGHGDLVRNAVAVLSPVNGGKIASRKVPTIDKTSMREYFESRCRVVVEIPPDPHLVAGAEIRIDELAPATRRAYLQLAAAITERF